MKGLLSLITAFLSTTAFPAAAEQISLLPPSGYDRSEIYVNLALFWITIIVLIVLIRIKLRETERVQAMESKAEEEKAPLLE